VKLTAAIADHAAAPSRPPRLPAVVGFAIVLAGALLLAAILDEGPMDGSTLFKPTNDLRLLLDVAMPALRAFAESVARRLLEDAAAFEAAAAGGMALLSVVAPSRLPRHRAGAQLAMPRHAAAGADPVATARGEPLNSRLPAIELGPTRRPSHNGMSADVQGGGPSRGLGALPANVGCSARHARAAGSNRTFQDSRKKAESF
jgi:hypothetical protein